MNPATCTGTCGTFSAVLACSVFVGSDMVFRLVIVAGAVSSDTAGDAGSGVAGLAALDSFNESSSASPNVSMLISLSVRSISCDWDLAVCLFVRCCGGDETKCNNPLVTESTIIATIHCSDVGY